MNVCCDCCMVQAFILDVWVGYTLTILHGWDISNDGEVILCINCITGGIKMGKHEPDKNELVLFQKIEADCKIYVGRYSATHRKIIPIKGYGETTDLHKEVLWWTSFYNEVKWPGHGEIVQINLWENAVDITETVVYDAYRECFFQSSDDFWDKPGNVPEGKSVWSKFAIRYWRKYENNKRRKVN